MAGEEQYYSPIIQAMIANAQDARQRQQNETLAQQHKEELALRQKEADRAAKHLDFLEKSEQQKIDSESEVRKAGLNHQLLLDKLNIGQALREGVLKAPVGSTQPQPGAVGLNQTGGTGNTFNVGGQQIDPSEFSNPQEAAQQEADKARMQAGAQVTGARTAALPLIYRLMQGNKNQKDKNFYKNMQMLWN